MGKLKANMAKIDSALKLIPNLGKVMEKIDLERRVPDSEHVMLNVPKAAEKAKNEKLSNANDVVWTNLKEDERYGKNNKESKLFYESKIKEKNAIKNMMKKKHK